MDGDARKKLSAKMSEGLGALHAFCGAVESSVLLQASNPAAGSSLDKLQEAREMYKTSRDRLIRVRIMAQWAMDWTQNSMMVINCGLECNGNNSVSILQGMGSIRLVTLLLQALKECDALQTTIDGNESCQNELVTSKDDAWEVGR